MFIVLISLLLLFLYIKWRSAKEFWTKKGIPSTGFNPIFGSLTFLHRQNPGLWMRELYNGFKGPYVGIWVFWRPGLVVNCPKLARQILIKDADNFRNRLVSSGNRDPLGALNLFTAKDPLWSSVRRRLTPVFTSAKLRSLHNLYHSKTSDLVERIRTDTKKGIKIDIREVYSDYTTDVIGEASFGVKCEATLTGDGALRNTTKEFTKYSVRRGLAWCCIFFFPDLVDIFGFKFFPKRSVVYFKRVFSMIVNKRGGYATKCTEPMDLLDALVKMKQDADAENGEMSEDVLLAQAMLFLQAGFDTSSAALAYTTYELAFHPRYQEKLYEELLQAKQLLGNKEFDAKVLAELTYLNCVLNETFRKYPNLGWLDRLAQNDYQVDDHLTIPAGTVVYVNAVGMQMDPQYFPQPELFQPERFLPENEQNIPPYTFMPFGEGQRQCIGKRFGMNTLRYALAAVVLNFQLRPWQTSPRPNDCKVEKRVFFFVPGETLSVEFIPRN